MSFIPISVRVAGKTNMTLKVQLVVYGM